MKKLSLQNFLETYIGDAEIYLEVWDINMQRLVFNGQLLDIKSLEREYQENRYEVVYIQPIASVVKIDEKIYENYPVLCINIDLRRS